MNDLNPKLIYIGSQFRVKVELSKEICLANQNVLLNLLQRAEKKLDSIKDKHEIEFFVIYKDRLVNTWKALIENKEIDPKKIICITIGLGGFHLKGATFKATPETPDTPIALTIIADPLIVKKWPSNIIRANIDYELLKVFGKVIPIQCSQLQGAVIRAKQGITCNSLPISQTSDTTKDSIEEKPYTISINRVRKEITFTIRSLTKLFAKTNMHEIANKVEQAGNTIIEKTGDAYTILTKNVVSTLEGLQSSQEILDLELPMTVLAGFFAPVEKKVAPNLIKLNISPDKMRATVASFDTQLYDHPRLNITKEWVEEQLLNQGLSKKSISLYYEDLYTAMIQKTEIKNFIVATGTKPKANEKPYLYETYKYTSKIDTLEDNENKSVDIREMHQSLVVKPGNVVAEICYVLPGDPGEDIFGNLSEAGSIDELGIEIGNGIVRQGDKFIASVEGTPIITKDSISLSECFMHNGDVNLRTGNVKFDGPVEIKGSVENGATVYASGAIVVKGDIRGTVISKKSIVVKGAIITGPTSRVEAGEDIQCDFIENSIIHCAGNLTVRKAILNSNVIVGGSIILLNKQDAMLAGGEISCLHDIKSTHIGFQRGALTTLNIGVDWKIEKALSIKKSRREKLLEVSKNSRLELRELVSKRSNQVTAKHNDLKEKMQKKVTQSRVLIEKLEEQINTISSRLAYNMKSKIYVEGTLSSNVKIHIGGSIVGIPNELAGVAIIAKKKRGSHIIQVEEAHRMDQQQDQLDDAS